jgi:hypothetical protein
MQMQCNTKQKQTSPVQIHFNIVCSKCKKYRTKQVITKCTVNTHCLQKYAVHNVHDCQLINNQLLQTRCVLQL